MTGSALVTFVVACSMVPVASQRSSLWQPWTWDGYNKFPSQYFAANPMGQFTSAQLDKITRFGIAMIEFRHGQHSEDGWADFKGENYSQIACAAIKAHKTDAPPCLVYRSGKWAGYFYKLQKAFLGTQSRFLSPDKDGECAEDMGFARGQVGNLNMTQTACKYDFAQSSVRDWYGNTMLAEIANEPSVDGVFIDNGQSVGCDNIAHYTDMSASTRANFLDLQLQSYAAGFQAIADANKYSVFSTTNQWPQPHGKILNFETGCGDTEENIVTAFDGIPWARNYEFFMWQTGNICSSQMLNFINETRKGVPVFVHVPYFPVGDLSDSGGCQEKCYLPTNNGQDFIGYTEEQFLNMSMAAFLIGMGPGSYFGFSNMDSPLDTVGGGGWFDVSWEYYDLYDIRVGQPLTDPIISKNSYKFERHFENYYAMVDCYTGEYELRRRTGSASPTSSPTPTNVLVKIRATAAGATCSDESALRNSFVSAVASIAGVGTSRVEVTSQCASVQLEAKINFPGSMVPEAYAFAANFSQNATQALSGTGFVASWGALTGYSAQVGGGNGGSGGEDGDGGAMVAAVVVVLVVVLVTGGGVAWWWCRRRRKDSKRFRGSVRNLQIAGRESFKQAHNSSSGAMGLEMGSPAGSGVLPSGWEKHFTDEGVPYFWNSTSGESRWERPSSVGMTRTAV